MMIAATRNSDSLLYPNLCYVQIVPPERGKISREALNEYCGRSPALPKVKWLNPAAGPGVIGHGVIAKEHKRDLTCS